MTLQERFDPGTARSPPPVTEAGSDDFGELTAGSPGCDRLTDGLINEARLSAIGVEIAYLDIMRALKNRLDVIAWRKQHPEIASEPITAADLHRRPTPHRNHDPLRLARPGSRPARTADLGGRRALSGPAARDLPRRSAHRADAGQHRAVRADHSRVSWHFTRWALSSGRSASASPPASSPA